MAFFDQRIRQTPRNIQCLYNLDRRVHAVKAYPILSPQGANIVIYGHEYGLTIVWRGGRRLKDPNPTKTKPEPAPKNDTVMVLDSDSDDAGTASNPASGAYVDKPVFEGAFMETTESGFSDVVQTLDLGLGTAVLTVAVLPLAPCAAQDAEPSVLQQQMVFAVTCATADVYVVTLPLTPPSHESKARPQLRTSLLANQAGRGAFGEVLIPLGGPSRRCDGVAIILAKQNAAAAAAATSSGGTTAKAAPAASAPRVIVAAHSRDASGTLRLWDVAIGTKRAASSSDGSSSLDRPLQPFQTEYLPHPLTSVAFNPTHPTQLLAVDPQHAVRVYDYTQSTIPADDLSEGPFPPQGSWLLSLYPPFARSSVAVAAARKPIVAAAWVAHGRAILALLADGLWGIWDIDRGSPSFDRKSEGIFSGVGSGSTGIRGAALTAFSVSGQIEGTTPLRNPVAGSRKSADGDFVPMTPHTRRDVLASTFGGSVDRLVAIRGGVEVVRQHQQHSSRSSTPGSESAVLWIGGADYVVAVIPDVARFWDAQLQRSSGGNSGVGIGLFNGARQTRMHRLLDLNASLLGERCCGVSAAARLAQHAPSRGTHDKQEERGGGGDGDNDNDNENDGSDDGDEGPGTSRSKDDKLSWIEILVQGESRLIFVHESSEDAFSGAFASRLHAATAASTWKRKISDAGGGGGSSALVVEPRPQKTGTVTFDLRGAQAAPQLRAPNRRPALTPSLFESPPRRRPGPTSPHAARTPQQPPLSTPMSTRHRSLFDENEVTLTQSMMKPPPSRPSARGLAFAGDLEEAANAEDDEEAAEDRNVEEEMLDIMEIDRAVEAMNQGQGNEGGAAKEEETVVDNPDDEQAADDDEAERQQEARVRQLQEELREAGRRTATMVQQHRALLEESRRMRERITGALEDADAVEIEQIEDVEGVDPAGQVDEDEEESSSSSSSEWSTEEEEDDEEGDDDDDDEDDGGVEPLHRAPPRRPAAPIGTNRHMRRVRSPGRTMRKKAFVGLTRQRYGPGAFGSAVARGPGANPPARVSGRGDRGRGRQAEGSSSSTGEESGGEAGGDGAEDDVDEDIEEEDDDDAAEEEADKGAREGSGGVSIGGEGTGEESAGDGNAGREESSER
ncbi:WD40 repeat-like-containing domain protein [Niveomyces insectorum RCEF 264]|uniref:WD40 repeat-like-containing domain protein n=1 Tax=Niveomyces insectorum RCEF 264 TaxID=1081102 RepID=A0A162MN10_9HYPO|nr:WD40 repeat-like-containing domain protein [Niveomyces insectorum RCEF 264]